VKRTDKQRMEELKGTPHGWLQKRTTFKKKWLQQASFMERMGGEPLANDAHVLRVVDERRQRRPRS